MSERTPTDDVLDALTPSDCEEISIFLRYPEIHFDKTEGNSANSSSSTLVPANKDNTESSPFSTTPSSTCPDRTLVTVSTAHTTPSRMLANVDYLEFGGWNAFIYLMQRSGLPQECLQYLTSLGQTILNIGTILHSTLRPNQPSSVVRIGKWLLKSIKQSLGRTQNEVKAISQLKVLVAFNVQPDESHAWYVYWQRARLIAKNVSLPSKRELDLIESLVFLYDMYVYEPFLQLPTSGGYDKETIGILNDIYDSLMAWWYSYKQWAKGMVHLRVKYMQPLLQKSSTSEVAKEEIADLQARIIGAKAAAGKTGSTDMKQAGEQLVNSLNLSARRPGPGASMKRSKKRYQREHTL